MGIFKNLKTFKMLESEYQEYNEDYSGICFSCGEIQYGNCEPDAEKYLCENCDKRSVYGIEQALLMGRIEFIAEKPKGEKPCQDCI